MVPVNFHQWKQAIRQALLAQAEKAKDEWDPFIAAWLCYALRLDGIENNQPLTALLERMKRWLEEDVWSYERNLGPIALALWLFKERGDSLSPESAGELVRKVCTLNADEKLSLLRDAEQVFLLALGMRAVEDESAKQHLIRIAKEQIRLGPYKRRVLYAALLKELNHQVPAPDLKPVDEGDVVSFVWWAEKYNENKQQAWGRFSSIAEQIALDPVAASEAQRILSIAEMAMLYEAMSKETQHPEPTLLFDYFPFHPRLRNIAREHFMNGEYLPAVFEATKVLNELIQECSGIRDKNEAELVQATMKQISDPSRLKIRFNNFLYEESGKSEQAGLAAICEGIFKAFRNPKGHKPKDHPLVQLDPYEALHELIVVNYLMIRIESGEHK
ncbi:MAG: hypothetical protein KatS3mg055_1678 [Chloroflexus sp.]|uniref:TIGR02391 family protein n=1 Tax=Chloroflexus sp. TaxID=1904827 RepID=UPI0021DECB5C|nr:TIGR02391 family protein [Chloroflexus sp.]GIV89160.1 MAG: hypothetical protein KatS3mg055_1678 [Chloroflexus sp.]